MKDHRLLDGRAVRDRILADVAERVRRASASHPVGRLVSVSIGEHKAAAVYVRGQANAAKKVGLRFEDQTWPATLTQEDCKARLVVMNDDPLGHNPHRRMTLTFAGIARARLVVVTVVGESKRDAFARVMGGDGVPATRIEADEVVWLVDPVAAGRR